MKAVIHIMPGINAWAAPEMFLAIMYFSQSLSILESHRTMTNYLKALVLLAALTALFIFIGFGLGDTTGTWFALATRIHC